MKVSIIGAGNVGTSLAYALSLRDVCNHIVLLDVFKDVAKAKAMDIYQSTCVFGSDIFIEGGDDYALINDSDIVVITAGSPRKDGQSREDLLLKNAEVVKNAAQNIKKFAPNSIIIVVTNPLDIMTYMAFEHSGFDKSKVLGMAGELDSARLVYEVANLKSIKQSQIKAKVIGTHSDEMLISRQNLNVNLDDEFEKISFNTKNGGAKIVKLLGTSAFYAPASAVLKMILSIKEQKDEILSACVILGENLASGRLVRLDNCGLKEILEHSLDKQDAYKLEESEKKVMLNIKFLRENLR